MSLGIYVSTAIFFAGNVSKFRLQVSAFQDGLLDLNLLIENEIMYLLESLEFRAGSAGMQTQKKLLQVLFYSSKFMANDKLHRPLLTARYSSVSRAAERYEIL